jgi:signal transduction histidine kinase/DNA-binding response OmpR family regulator
MDSMIFLFQIPVHAEDTVKKNVLILNSYENENNIISGYQSKDWTTEIIDSINLEFINSKKNITVAMDYMDSNINSRSEYWDQLYRLYKYKYKDNKFDTIIALDDNAFNFLIKYGDELFPNTPVVFSGVNNFDNSMISNHPLFTGLTKSDDIKSTIDVGLKLHPNTKQVFVVLDKTLGGIEHKHLIENIASLYKDKVNFLFSDDENIINVKEKINNLPQDTIIYIDAKIKNDIGNYIPVEQSVDILFKDINIPVYSRCYIWRNKQGVGGMITEGSDLGKEIGTLTLRVLDGEKISDIPVKEDSSHYYEFNYEKLQQFNIDIKDLPKDSKILNKPTTYYDIPKKLIIYIVVGILFIIILQIIIVNFSIYKRKLVEKALAENENLLKTLINAIPDIIYFKDSNNILLEANDSFLNLLNVKGMNYKFKKIEDLYNGSSLSSKNFIVANKYDENLWKNTDILRSEEIIVDEEKETSKIYDVIRKLLLNDDGTPMGIVILGRDITEIKQIQNELQKSKEIAESANAIKSEFLANISHEIRTPLNAIIGFSDIMAQLIEDSKQKEYIEIIDTSAKNLLFLINDILDLSKIEAGKLEIIYDPVNPRDILEEIQKILKQKISMKNLQVIIEIQKEFPTVMMLDEIRLRQVLLNIVGNAVKFTEVGYIKIAMKKERNVNDANLINVVICVEDTGIGIPENEQQRIFESFTQQSGQSIKKFGGTGLGLAISKQLVEMMNGNIILTSAVGKGSTFTIILHDVQISLNEIPVNEEDDTYCNKIKFQKAKVLVVDDIESNRYLFEEVLKSAGLEVIMAGNGLEAIEIAQREIPDLIIMDNRMPVMDGIEATRAIRKISYLADIPIIAASANAIKEDKEKFLDAGINEYITKPINVNYFLSTLQKCLKVVDKSIELTEIQEINNLKDQKYTFIPKIHGVNINEGIERLGGNKKLYIKMLIKFFHDNENLVLQIGQSIEAKDYDVSLDLLHGLKGVSGNLAITCIYNLIVDLESKIKQGIPYDYVELFCDISDNFKKVSEEIYDFEKENKVIKIKKDCLEPILDKSQIIYCLDKLKKYLQDYDAKAVKYFNKIKGKLVGIISESDIKNLEEKVKRYEFDIALTHINFIIMNIKE